MNDRKLYEKVKPVEKGFPIKFARGASAFRMHWHEYIELLYYLEDGKVFCNGKNFLVNNGFVRKNNIRIDGFGKKFGAGNIFVFNRFAKPIKNL